MQTQDENQNYLDVELWYLVAPAANTTQNIVVNFRVANGLASNVVGAIEYGGVDQFNYFGASEAGEIIGSGSITTTATTLYANSRLLVNFGMNKSAASMYMDPLLSDRWLDITEQGAASAFGDRLVTSIGSYSDVNGYSGNWVGIQQMLELVSLRPGPTPTSTPTRGGFARMEPKDPTSTPAYGWNGTLTTFPNPARNQILAGFHLNEDGQALLQMYDLGGHLVKRWELGHMQEGDHETWLDISNFAFGIYFLTLDLDSGTGFRKQALFKIAIVH